MPLVDVASVAELEDGVPRAFTANGREVVLIQWRDRVFALRNVCPHQTQSFVGGVITGRIVSGSTPGRFRVDNDNPVLSCPWHHWEFELETGRCPIDTRVRVRSYTTVIKDDRVMLDMT